MAGGCGAECSVPGAPAAPPGPPPGGRGEQKSPQGSGGAQCLPCSTAPGSCSLPWPQTLSERRAPWSSCPSEESRGRRHRSGQQGNVGPRRPECRSPHSTPGRRCYTGGSATRVAPARPRVPQPARAAEGSRGGGAAARAPPPQTPKLPTTPSTKLRSHRAAPRAPPRAEPEQLRALAAEKDNRRPLPRRRRWLLEQGASTAVSTEPKRLAAAAPAPRPPCTEPCPPAHAPPADWEWAGQPDEFKDFHWSTGLPITFCETNRKSFW